MPKYKPTDEELDESYAEAEAPPVSPPPETEPETETESVDEENAVASEVLVPNEVLTGPDGTPPKAGDEIVIKVVKNYGDESSIVYAPKTGPQSETEGVDEELAALDTEEM